MIKLVLVGCGRIAKRHSELLGYSEIDGAKLVAVCDLDMNKSKSIADKFDIPAYNCMHKMMKEVDTDVIVVLTESGNHANNVIELASYGKDIVVEKPMALTLEDADKMISICELNKIRLFVVKQNRFNVPIKKLKQAVDENRFGKLVLGTIRVRWCRPQEYYDQDAWRGTWKMDGGILTNQASHHVDLLHYMMGDVESVQAMSNTSLVEIDAEDTVVVNLKFKNGSLGIIEATGATRPKDLEGSISILGENGTVVVGGFAVNKMETWNFVDMNETDDEVITKYSENPPNVYGFGHKAYYEQIVNTINKNASPEVGGTDGRKSLELITAIYESIETKKEVYLDKITGSCRLGK